MNKFGLITYDCSHLKSTEILERSFNKFSHLYLIPFQKRKKRDISIRHRPEQFEGPAIKNIARLYNIKISPIDDLNNALIKDNPKNLIVGGAGILEEKIVNNYIVINCHPGIIPMTRGLDSFKWAIYNKQRLGVTLHKIDNNIDKGDVIHHSYTPLFKEDDVFSFAKRHYRNEINIICDYINGKLRPEIFTELEERKSNMRMPASYESDFFGKFESYKRLFQEN